MQVLNCPLNGLQLIEASAGTGKTYTIASLYLRLILFSSEDLPIIYPRNIAVVTYTRAATQELRGRIRRKLLEARDFLKHLLQTSKRTADISFGPIDQFIVDLCSSLTNPPQALSQLTNAVALLDEAAIYTIHGFCQKVISGYSLECGTPFKWEFSYDEFALYLDAIRDYWRMSFYGCDPLLAQGIADLWDSPQDLMQSLREPLLQPIHEVRGLTTNSVIDIHTKAIESKATLARIWNESKDWLPDIAEKFQLKKNSFRKDHLANRIDKIDQWLSSPTVYNAPEALIYFTTSKIEELSVTAQIVDHPLFNVAENCCQSRDQLKKSILAEALHATKEIVHKKKILTGEYSFNDLLEVTADALNGPNGEKLAMELRKRYPFALVDEFQDTDSLQWQIFSSIYNTNNIQSTGLFLIGDPKQAIYSFRGADVRTYIEARNTVARPSRYNLIYNYRSTPQILQGINAIFSSNADPFFSEGEIGFVKAEIPHDAAERASPLLRGGAVIPAINFLTVGSDPDNRSTDRDYQIAEHCAEEIAKILSTEHDIAIPIGGNTLQGSRKLEAKDIAVLTRSNFQAELIQQALRRRRIGSIYQGARGVFESQEAVDLLRMLEAVSSPNNHRKVRTAIAGHTLGFSLLELNKMFQQSIDWEHNLIVFFQAQQIWDRRGFLPMFWHLLRHYRLAERLLKHGSIGYRSLTNWLHLGEILQTESEQHSNPLSLISRLRELIANNQIDDEKELRLETDEQLLKIVTIHRSKGLEYEVVFIPFFQSRVKKKDHVVYHDKVSPKRVLDFSAAPNTAMQVFREQLAEDLRLFYVAITRAKKAIYLFPSDSDRSETSPLGYLLRLSEKQESTARPLVEDITTALSSRSEESRINPEVFSIRELPAIHRTILPPSSVNPNNIISTREFTGSIARDWKVSSYTALSNQLKQHHTAGTLPDSIELDPKLQELELAEVYIANSSLPESTPTIHNFPKGPITGIAIHAILEKINREQYTKQILNQIVSSELSINGIDAKWEASLISCLMLIMEKELYSPIDNQTFSLAQIAPQHKQVELEFDLRVEELSLKKLFQLYDKPKSNIHTDGHHNTNQLIEDKKISGLLHGFMDLVLDYQGKYYLFDYKTNWLGPDETFYSIENLEREMIHHNYHLQYALYAVALKRFLERHCIEFNYEQRFGGVYYLFIRGITESRDTGIYYAKPSLEFLQELDIALGGSR